eukprot:5353712-Lingulodinium_polyedra.AAC.1
MVGAPRRPVAAVARPPVRPPARSLKKQIRHTRWMTKQTSAETRSAAARPFHVRQQAAWDAQHVQ